MTPLLHAVRAHRDTSNYGFDGFLSVERFTPDPPVQNPNGAITQTMEVCSSNQNGQNNCGFDHVFVYQFQLGDFDPGTITSFTLTVTGQNGGIFSNSPTYGVLICAQGDPKPPVPCSPFNADLTNCVDSDSFVVNESGVGTSTYSQTWNFGSCSTKFVAGQMLAIFVDLCTSANDQCPADGTPIIQPPLFVTINVSRSARFVPTTPCRIVDTRNPTGPFGGPAIAGQTFRNFDLPLGPCGGIPISALAYSLNVTVVPHGPLGYLTVWPTGEAQPYVSTVNSLDGRTKANAAIASAGTNGAISVFASNTTDLVLDIDGYFEANEGFADLEFYPLSPCRVADTRYPNDQGLGAPYLKGQSARDFPVLNSTCGIPNTAQAYSFNFTAVPHGALGYLTAWPAGQSRPGVSTLNAPTGTYTANAAIVQAGTGGDIEVFASNDSDLVIDVNGYFAPIGLNGLSLYAVPPCRVLDTSKGNGQFVGTIVVDVVGSVCQPSNLAQAYVFNATVIPPGPLGYLTLWPDGVQQPGVSTLNAIDGVVTSNMAIVPTNNGSIDAFASNLTQLDLDISAYFAP